MICLYSIESVHNSYHKAELEILSKYFEKIYVIPTQKYSDVGDLRKIPKNVIIEKKFSLYINNRLFKAIFFGITILINFGKKILNKKKINSISFYNETKYTSFVIAAYFFYIFFIKKIQKKTKSILLYSFWFNQITETFSIISSTEDIAVITRAHGYDLYKHMNPLQNFIRREEVLDKLHGVYVASRAGAEYMKVMYPNFASKIYSSRLGLIGTSSHAKIKESQNYIFVSVSRIDSNKQVVKIAKTLILLSKKMSEGNIVWHHFGSGPDRNTICILLKGETTKNLTSILHGNVSNEELMKWYEKNYVDFFINFSITEGGVPVSIMEAMSHQIPIFASDSGGASEVVDEKNGFIFDPYEDPANVASKIEKFITTNYSDMESFRNASLTNFRKYCDANNNYAEFIENVLEVIRR